jgi:pimeloyl-ACP methyl ester carboxylesterase
MYVSAPLDYISFKCSARDGLMIAGRKYGCHNKDPHPVICLAGITRNSSDFHDLALYLSSPDGGNRRVVSIDYRGRGQSEYDRDWQNYTLSVEANDTLDVLTALGLGSVNIIGSSRGGLIAMMLATMRPGALKSVILNDMGPVIDATGLVRIWRTYDTKNLPSTFEEAANLRERLGSSTSPAFTKNDWQKEAHRLYKLENGKLTLQFDKKLLTSLRSINLDERLPDMWADFAALTKTPTMAIRAENTDILSEETFEAMKMLHPNITTEIALGQNHAPILSVGGLEKKIAAFLEKQV